MEIFIQQLVNSLTYGSLLGFIALGYTMVYGILKLINFAHGDLVTLSIFLTISLVSQQFQYNLPFFKIIIAIFIVIIIALVIQFFVYKPLRNAPRLSLVVSALGAGMVIQNLIILIWGANPKIFPDNLILTGSCILFGVTVSYLSILILSLNVLIMIILHIFINNTRLGIAIKASSIDHTTALLMGINPNYVMAIIFIIGAILGALGGILIGATYKSISFNMGFDYGIKAFIAAIIGGIGSIYGAMLGGILIGIIYTFCAGFISSVWADSLTYSILILFLILKPEGIFGKKQVNKV